MIAPRIADLLRRTSGLDADALGRGVLARAVHKRMKQIHVASEDEYATRLEQSADELQRLVDDVVVHETSFFRDAGAYAAFADWVRTAWLPAMHTRPLSILSIPCSTGEEAYSIAMTILDVSRTLPFRIDAVDISSRALAVARAGEYGAGSFRSKELEYRTRYFDRTPKGHRVKDELREHIEFRQGNLLEDRFSERRHDVVFCRNLLIYFDAASQANGMKQLSGLVATGGLLFLGPAETFLTAGTAFRSISKPMAFAFEKLSGIPERTIAVPEQKRAARVEAPVPRTMPVRNAHPRPASKGRPTMPAPGAHAEDNAMARAERFADSGKLEDAIALCNSYIAEHGANARAFFLLGVVSDAQGRAADAVSWFRKTLYLQPGHEQALMHLSILAGKSGGASRAQHLGRRARAAGVDVDAGREGA
ncbi:MAG: CheR family methyltransferase [Longimicrobiales bacterium]